MTSCKQEHPVRYVVSLQLRDDRRTVTLANKYNDADLPHDLVSPDKSTVSRSVLKS